MAKNRIFAEADQLGLPVPDGTVSGQAIAVGQIPGVCLTDKRSSDGKATIQFDGAFNLSVKGENGSGNSAVAVGDILYLAEGKLTKIATGVRFGYALATITSGSTKTILVKVGY